MKLSRLRFSGEMFSLHRNTIVIVIGLALAALSIFYTWRVSVDMKHEDEMAIEQLRRDERNAVEMWEDILRNTNIGGQMVYNPELLNKLAEHTNVPLIIADERLNVLASGVLGKFLWAVIIGMALSFKARTSLNPFSSKYDCNPLSIGPITLYPFNMTSVQICTASAPTAIYCTASSHEEIPPCPKMGSLLA